MVESIVSLLQPCALGLSEECPLIPEGTDVELLSQYSSVKSSMNSVESEVGKELAKVDAEFDYISMALDNKLLEEYADAQDIVDLGAIIVAREFDEIQKQAAQLENTVADMNSEQLVKEIDDIIVEKNEETQNLTENIVRYTQVDLEDELESIKMLSREITEQLKGEDFEIVKEELYVNHLFTSEIYNGVASLSASMGVEDKLQLDALGM